jgi:hypothetical protein
MDYTLRIPREMVAYYALIALSSGRLNPGNRKFAHANSALHAASCERRGIAVWTPERVEALRAAYRAGGIQAAVAAFPGCTIDSLRNALRRYGTRDLGRPKPLLGRDAVRARIEALPLDDIRDRLAELLLRRSDFGGVA